MARNERLMKLASLITGYQKQNFDEVHWSLLAVLGIVSFLFAGYFGLAASQIIHSLMETTNKPVSLAPTLKPDSFPTCHG